MATGNPNYKWESIYLFWWFWKNQIQLCNVISLGFLFCFQTTVIFMFQFNFSFLWNNLVSIQFPFLSLIPSVKYREYLSASFLLVNKYIFFSGKWLFDTSKFLICVMLIITAGNGHDCKRERSSVSPPPPRSLCLVHKQHFVTAPLSLSCIDTQWCLPWGDTDPSMKVQGCVMTNKIRNT